VWWVLRGWLFYTISDVDTFLSCDKFWSIHSRFWWRVEPLLGIEDEINLFVDLHKMESNAFYLESRYQGYNATKVISEVYASFVLCSVLSLGGNVNTRQMSQPDMGSIFHKKNQWNIVVIGNFYVNYQNYQFNAFNLLGY